MRLQNDGRVSVKINFTKEPEEVRLWRSLQWDLAEFFFAFERAPGNLYDRFFDKFSASALLSLRVATLNYDRLLQLAARHRQIELCYSRKPNLAEPLALCLPHGASYLAPTARAVVTGNGLVLSGSGEIAGLIPSLDGPLLELKDLYDLRSRRNEFFPPAMSYIDPDKLTGSGQSFLLHQREVWCSWLRQANRVALVGVRAFHLLV